MKKPNDINIAEIDSKIEYFYGFIKQVKTWIEWFDRFIDIFQYIIEWFKTWKMEGAEQLFTEIQTTKTDSTITVLKIKLIVQKVLKILNPFKNLERLCDLFNCMQSFIIVDPGTLSDRDQVRPYITQLKSSYSNNTFTVDQKSQEEKCFSINDRQHVHWSIASAQHQCNVKIEYRINGSLTEYYELFNKKDVPLDNRLLQGKFQTQRGGEFVITIDNKTIHNPRTIWYRLTQTSLSTCHLFHGIFNMYLRNCLTQSSQSIKEKDLSKITEQVFAFIDKVLKGETTLEEMDQLKTVFHDKNINVRDEVQKLYTNQSIGNTTKDNEQQIDQVCEWLRTYQVYSHLSIIIDCVRKFNIISTNDENDESMDSLQGMTIEDDCSLKDMSKTYKELYHRFQKLSNHHLQLIKVINECPNVVQMMEKFDLYSPNGLRRFQELRDNLTTQFQLQERNNMILNSWIMSYTLCKPFVDRVESLEEFINNLSQLSNIDESSLGHIRSKFK